MPSREKYIFHMFFGAFDNTSRNSESEIGGYGKTLLGKFSDFTRDQFKLVPWHHWCFVVKFGIRNEKRLTEVGFEPTPPKRLEP